MIGIPFMNLLEKSTILKFTVEDSEVSVSCLGPGAQGILFAVSLLFVDFAGWMWMVVWLSYEAEWRKRLIIHRNVELGVFLYLSPHCPPPNRVTLWALKFTGCLSWQTSKLWDLSVSASQSWAYRHTRSHQFCCYFVLFLLQECWWPEFRFPYLHKAGHVVYY